MRVPVATYNLAGALATSPRYYDRVRRARARRMAAAAAASLAETARVLGAAGARVVALQEADTSYAGGEEIRQWERLAELLSLDCRFLPLFRLDLARVVQVCSGLALLSAFPIVSARPVSFPPQSLSPARRVKAWIVGARKALHCTLDLGGRELHVVNAHLSHDSARRRELELEALLDYCAPLGTVVLAGDLNFTPPRAWRPGEVHPQPIEDDCAGVLRRFRARYDGRLLHDARLGDFRPDAADLDEIATCEAARPRYKFDYLFVLTRDPQVSLEPETVLDYQASDHRPVLATVVFEPDGTDSPR